MDWPGGQSAGVGGVQRQERHARLPHPPPPPSVCVAHPAYPPSSMASEPCVEYTSVLRTDRNKSDISAD